MRNKRYHKAVEDGYKGTLRQWANENYNYDGKGKRFVKPKSVEQQVKQHLKNGTYFMSE